MRSEQYDGWHGFIPGDLGFRAYFSDVGTLEGVRIVGFALVRERGVSGLEPVVETDGYLGLACDASDFVGIAETPDDAAAKFGQPVGPIVEIRKA